MFDLFVANNDRAFGPERRNLAVSKDGGLILFDHGNSCFYRDVESYNGRPAIKGGIARLDSVEADLAAMDDQKHRGAVYFQLLNDWGMVERWCERVSRLPDYTIESAVTKVPTTFSRPSAEERDRLVAFLLRRRHALFDDICKCRARMFPGLPERPGHG